MKTKRNIPITNIGLVSLTMIIILLSMVLFTMLSLSEASRDYSYSSKLMAHNTEYLEASNTAQEQIGAISEALHAGNASTECQLDGVKYFEVSGAKVFFAVDINDRQELDVALDISDGRAVVTSYVEAQSKEWNGDMSLHVVALE